MVAVTKKYVKWEELMTTIDQMLKTYSNIRVEYPSNVEEYFLVKAWERKKVVE